MEVNHSEREVYTNSDVEQGECYRLPNYDTTYMRILCKGHSYNAVSLNSGHTFTHGLNHEIIKVVAKCTITEESK